MGSFEHEVREGTQRQGAYFAILAFEFSLGGLRVNLDWGWSGCFNRKCL
jgi:hypothetical protein